MCLGKAANLLLNKHFLVSLREGFPGACFEKQGRVSKHGPWVQAGLNWIQLLPAFCLGRAVYILLASYFSSVKWADDVLCWSCEAGI